MNNVSYHVKDLAKLGRDLRRTVIVDNNPFSFILQPSNGIPCVPFTGDNPQDNEVVIPTGKDSSFSAVPVVQPPPN